MPVWVLWGTEGIYSPWHLDGIQQWFPSRGTFSSLLFLDGSCVEQGSVVLFPVSGSQGHVLKTFQSLVHVVSRFVFKDMRFCGCHL